MKDKEPKHHHVVPKFLLERFAKDGTLELIDRDAYGRVIRTNPRHALASNDFYTVETDQGHNTLVEKLFATEIEGPGAVAIRRLVDEGRLIGGRGNRGPIALLIAFQHVRGPGWRHALVEHAKAVARKVATIATPSMIMKAAQERGEELTDDELTDEDDVEMTDELAAETVEFAKNGNYKIVIKRAANLHVDSVLRTALELVPHLEKRTWRLLEFTDPVLITSDEPVALLGDDVRAPGGARGAVGAHAIAFPFDPWHALLMYRPDMGFHQGRAAGTAYDAEIINTHVAFHAHRFIVRYPGTDPLRGLKVPRKAPPVFEFGDMVAISPNRSVEHRKNYLAKVASGKIRFSRAPDDDDDSSTS